MARLRPLGLPYPPATDNPNLDAWLAEVHGVVNGLPFSYFSTAAGPESIITAPIGFIGIETGSGVTKMWQKTSGLGNTGWSALSWI